MTPAERSNSPPIISSATGTATIPYWAAWSVHPAAISGRVSTRVSGPTRTSRSSGATLGAAVSAIAGPSVQRGGRPHGRPPRVVLASALRCERGHLGRVRLVDDAGAGQHRLAVADRVQVRLEQDGEYDRQVSLQVLLLVDREQHLAGPDLLDRAADVERPGLRALREDREARNRDVRVEAEEGVELLVGVERRLHLRLRARDVRLCVRDRHHLDVARAEDRLDA